MVLARGCDPDGKGKSISVCAEDCLPVGPVEFVLPLQLSVFCDAVIPQDQAAGHPLVHLVRQISQEQRHVLHRNLLQTYTRKCEAQG